MLCALPKGIAVCILCFTGLPDSLSMMPATASSKSKRRRYPYYAVPDYRKSRRSFFFLRSHRLPPAARGRNAHKPPIEFKVVSNIFYTSYLTHSKKLSIEKMQKTKKYFSSPFINGIFCRFADRRMRLENLYSKSVPESLTSMIPDETDDICPIHSSNLFRICDAYFPLCGNYEHGNSHILSVL
jgi:hypothetical protein